MKCSTMNCSLYLFFLVYWLCPSLGIRIGNPDDSAKIERPCPTYDLNCIRKYFAEHAHCKKSFGPAPDPLIRPQPNMFLPRINTSITITNERVEGLNGRIEEFYINRDTYKLVIAVEFLGLNVTSRDTYLKFHRRSKEPVVTRAYAGVFYPSVIVTAVIPQLDDLQLDKSECTAFANDANPPIFIGPSAAQSTDPQVQIAITALLSNLATNVQELFLTDASYYISTYIQYNICDFGIIVM